MREKKIHVWELPNGFTVYSRHDDISRVSGVGARVGSIYDPPDARGMAHFYEHVTCRRSRTVTGEEFDFRHLKYLGGPDDDVNIRTDQISTFYGHNGLIRTDHMLKVFDAMATVVRDRLIDPEGLLVESAAVLQETYLRGKDLPEDAFTQLVLELLYAKNPVRNRIDCEPDELAQMTLRRVRQFGRRYYVPRNMFMIMLGPSHERVKNLAAKYFGDVPDRGTPRLDYDRSDDVPVLSESRYGETSWPKIQQTHVAVAWPTETAEGKNGIALELLSSILEHRLSRRLREGNRNPRSGAYRNPVMSDQSFVHGYLEASFATLDPEFAKRGHDIICEEAARLRQELVTAKEFDAVSTYAELCWLDAFRFNADSLCEMIIADVCNGDLGCEGLQTYQDRLRKLTRKKLRDVANRFLVPQHIHAVMRPE